MHEQAIIDKILETVRDKINAIGIELEIGELVGVDPQHLQELITERTGWTVHTKTIASKVKCSCGYEGPARIRQRLHDQVIYDCPQCENLPKVLQGKKIKIKKVTYK
jgi:Zn finger protein HypA/HybF involved in hydrogenase expression